MKVKELIEELENFDKNMEVVLMGKSYYKWEISEVEHETDENGSKIIIREGDQIHGG